jgi:hypothetical protein
LICGFTIRKRIGTQSATIASEKSKQIRRNDKTLMDVNQTNTENNVESGSGMHNQTITANKLKVDVEHNANTRLKSEKELLI